jgi:hypothetical protein
MARVRPDLGERHLVSPPCPLDRQPVDLTRPRPALRRPEHDHPAPVVERPVEQLGEATMGVEVVVARVEEERLVPVAAE